MVPWAHSSQYLNDITIGTTAVAGLTVVTDRQTDRPRQSVCSNRPLRSAACSLRSGTARSAENVYASPGMVQGSAPEGVLRTSTARRSGATTLRQFHPPSFSGNPVVDSEDSRPSGHSTSTEDLAALVSEAMWCGIPVEFKTRVKFPVSRLY